MAEEKQCPFHDAFKKERKETAVHDADMDGDTIPILLRYKDIRQAAGDPETFSSDAPFRVPIPSEESVRSIRQLPIETDPPEHTEYRAIVEPFFRRPKNPQFVQCIHDLVQNLIRHAIEQEHVEVVREFALPLQSRALTHLLNVPESEAEEWISWGTHVFRDGEGSSKGAELEAYINRQLDRAEEKHGDDFFSALIKAEFRGRRLTREECVGFANLTFAGGRDTVINMVSSIIAYLGHHPEILGWLRDDPRRAICAAEEFFRVVSPLTHIGRVCPADTSLQGKTVRDQQRISLAWASGNFDETVFKNPETVHLDRKPNPHIAFGSGPHTCLGALHARLLIRTLLARLAESLSSIELIDKSPTPPSDANYRREVGFEKLTCRFLADSENQTP